MYRQKYFKYKSKYMRLKNGGSISTTPKITVTNNFPYVHTILPPLFTMLNNLTDGWRPFRGDNKVTVRKFPSDYLSVDWATNYFSEIQRMDCNKVGLPSPMEYWKKLDAAKQEELLSKGVEYANDQIYGSRETYVCNNFSLQFCYNIIMDTVGKGAKILDPSSGWGDRIIAALASQAETYRGTDPNPDLAPVYKKIVDSIKNWEPYKRVSIEDMHKRFYVHQNYFEKEEIEPESFDLALTSPPYYTFEEYNNAQNGLTYQEWLNQVYTPYMELMYRSVKPTGWIVVYVENFSYKGQKIPLQDDTISIINNLGGIRQKDYLLRTSDENTEKPWYKDRKAVAWKKPNVIKRVNTYTGKQFRKLEGVPQHMKHRFNPSVYFSRLNDKDLDKMKFTNVSLYSTTSAIDADKMCDYIVKQKGFEDPTTLIVIDATANIGGDTFGFFRKGFKSITSVEYDTTICEALTNNVNVYNASDTVRVICGGDYSKLYKTLDPVDIVIMDAPWGGPDYKKHDKVKLFLGELNVLDITEYLLANKRARMVVLKVPYNFDMEDRPNLDKYTYAGYDVMVKSRVSYKILIWIDQ
jgi:DNA modification methylase/predicted RNA methylase